MHEHDGPAPLELVKDRIETAVTQIAATGVRHHRHAIKPEHVERVLDLLQRAVDVRERKRCKSAEAVGTVALDLGEVLIDATRERPRGAIVAEMNAGRADRRHGDVDPGLVEVGDRPSRLQRGGLIPPAAFPSSLDASQ